MAELRDVILYLCRHYPHASELSRARLTKMVYLADWKFAIEHGRQMTRTNWYFDNYGPFVWDIWETAQVNKDLFEIEETQTMFANRKNLVKLRNLNVVPQLSNDEVQALNHVISTTQNLNWGGFIDLVYSTYPVRCTERYSPLKLVEQAQAYTGQNASVS